MSNAKPDIFCRFYPFIQHIQSLYENSPFTIYIWRDCFKFPRIADEMNGIGYNYQKNINKLYKFDNYFHLQLSPKVVSYTLVWRDLGFYTSFGHTIFNLYSFFEHILRGGNN